MKNLPKNLQNGLVLWLDWKVDGTTALDASGLANNGTTVGSPTTQRVVQNNGFVFNGSSQYMTIPSTMVNLNSTFTFNIWIKPISNWAIISKFLSEWDMLSRFDNTNKTITFDYKNSSLTWSLLTTPNNSIESAVYSMVTYVRNSAWVRFIYINGILKASGWGWDTATNNASIFYLNVTNTGTPSEYLNSINLNTQFYTRDLSATEIQQLHKATYIK
jgi:hypothetical protein